MNLDNELIIVKTDNNKYLAVIDITKEFILLMKRGPQIIYPKDISQIVIEANISSSSKVLEIGTGSGALTLYLINILNGYILKITFIGYRHYC